MQMLLFFLEDLSKCASWNTPFGNWKSEIENLSVTHVTTLSPVIGAGLGVNEYAEQFRGILLETDFQFRLDIVNARQGKIVRQRAMAGEVEAPVDAFEDEIMDVEDFRKLRGNHPQPVLKFCIAH
jgi:hypothetical protein